MSPSEFVTILGRERASAIIRTKDQRSAAEGMEAAVRAGFKVIEFTLTIPGALELIHEFSANRALVVGAGTVLQPDEAQAAVSAGASFLVSPVVDSYLLEAATDLGVAVMPGAHTPTELWRAYQLGAPLQKLFPAPVGGPAWLRTVLGPMPFLRVVPTQGVEADNVAKWLEAGAFAVGFTSALFDRDDLAARRFDQIEARARLLLANVPRTT